MTARTEIVTMLKGVLPDDIDVIAYSHNIEAPSKSTVMVRVDKVRNSPAGLGLREYDFSLIIIAAKTTYGPADDELDMLLEDVLFALSLNDVPNGVTFTEATRATYGEPDSTNPAYEVAISVTASITEPAVVP